MARLTSLLPTLLIFLTGCYTYYKAPGAVGKVVNAATGAPVGGAHIHRVADSSNAVLSDKTGHFNLPPVSRTQIMFMYLHNPPSISDSFVVSAGGYATNEFHGTASSSTFWRAALGRVLLKR